MKLYVSAIVNIANSGLVISVDEISSICKLANV